MAHPPYLYTHQQTPLAWSGSVGTRKISTKIASKHSDIVIAHDSERERKWHIDYLEPGFELVSVGGESCSLWVRKNSGSGRGRVCDAIDIHSHVSLSGGFPSPRELIETMEGHLISKAVLMSVVSPEYRKLVTTEEVITICSEFPDKFIPFVGIDPRLDCKGLDHYISLGCKGIGEYIPNIQIDSELNMGLFHQAEECGLPVTIHFAGQVGGTYGCYDEIGLYGLENVLKECPDLIILGHSPVFWSEIGKGVRITNRNWLQSGPFSPGRVVKLMRKYENLHGDLSGLSGYIAISRDKESGYKFLEEFSDRLHFGTDITMPFQRLPLRRYIEQLLYEGLISTTTYTKVMYGNTKELLGV